ncbi:unnamed protein product [Calypogeia fissa]
MNSSANTSEQEGEPNWETGNWDQSGSVAGLENSRPYAGNRLDWDWDNPMIIAQHPGAGANDGDSDRKSPIVGSMASSLRAYTGILSSGFPSNFSQNPMGVFSSSGIRSFAGMDSTSITTSSGLHGVMSTPNIPGIPGLAPTSGGHVDMRSSFEQRRRQYFGVMDPDQKGHSADFHVKRESEICGGDGHGGRIGLNLGVRTYFSTEDTAAGRLGKRHRANSPSSQVPMCQAEGCKADLSAAKHYHRRHKVCELHSKASNVTAAGHTQRFCQQCSRFHLLSEFDEGKRSCRKRLADHNRRRRKPQPIASAGGGTTAESIALKTSTDPKSMLMHLKKSGSPSSASLDESDDKTGSAGNNLQLRTSGGFEHPPQPVALNSQTSSISGTDAQVLLSAMSIAPPVPLLIQNAKRQLSILPGNSQEAAVYQQFLQGVGAQTGPNLSLSSLGGGLGLGNRGPRHSSGQNYNGMEPPVPWLRPRSDISQTVSRPSMNLQLVPEKSGPRSNQQISCIATTSGGQVYPTSIQNLLPSMQSREISGADWIVGSRDSGSQFGSTCLSNMSSGTLDGHQFGLLEDSATIRDDTPGTDQQGRAVEFLQQHGGNGTDVPCTGGTDLKFPELQALRPGSFGPSIYDSHHNIL